MRLLLLAFAFSLSGLAHADNGDNAGINAIYDRMVAAYDALDPSGLETVYAADAVYFNSQINTPALAGRDAIVAMLGGFLLDGRGKSDYKLAFRITGRTRLGKDAVLDTGFYRLLISGRDGTSATHVGKFMTTATRQTDGRWAFQSDTDTPMPVAVYDTATALPGVKFDQ